jgi:hypothetical protein
LRPAQEHAARTPGKFIAKRLSAASAPGKPPQKAFETKDAAALFLHRRMVFIADM